MRNRVLVFNVFLFAILSHAPVGASDISVSVHFSSSDISVIHDFYGSQHGGGKGGKNKPKPLPPGIAKNLAQGKPLPPGIAKQALPTGLSGRLSAAPDGFERVIVGGKILLVEIATQVVHDILEDIILR